MKLSHARYMIRCILYDISIESGNIKPHYIEMLGKYIQKLTSKLNVLYTQSCYYTLTGLNALWEVKK